MNSLTILLLAASMGFSAPPTERLTEKDCGQTVKMLVGSIFEVVLEGNPTTGYVWSVASVDAKILQPVGEAAFKPDTMARGSGGMVMMRFKAVGRGKTSLKLIYHRPFEKNKPPVKTFELTIEVQQHGQD